MPPSPKALFVSTLLAALFSAACGERAGSESKKGGLKKGDQVVPVAIAKVVARDVPVDLQVIGNVEAFSTVTVKSRITGPIDKVHFSEGGFVRKGDKLFSIDPAPFLTAVAQAEANVARDRAIHQQAQANLNRDLAQQKFLTQQANRFASLQREGVVSKEQAEQQQSSVDVVTQSVAADQAAIASAQASIEAGEAALKTARIMLGYTSVNSPVDGRTGTVLTREGTLATANVTELVTISQVQPVYVTFSVPESQLGIVKEAMTKGRLPVSAAPPDDPAHPETGQLSFVDSSVDQSTGTIKLKGQFANGQRKLWPGAFVRVTLRLGVTSNALMVPNQAVQTGQDGSFVYRMKADRTVEAVPVKTVGRVNEDLVVGSGLSEGDTVVTEGQLRLAPGMRVRLREDGPAGGARKGAGKGGKGGGMKKKEE